MGVGVGITLPAADVATALPNRPTNPAPPSAGADPRRNDACQRRVAELEALVAMREQLVRQDGTSEPPQGGASEPPQGEASIVLEWPEYVPRVHTQEGLEASIEEAAMDCGLPIEAVDTDCTEPPCIAILRNFAEGDEVAWSQLSGCPVWQSRYPGGSHMHAETIDCGDGSEDRIVLVSGAWKELGPVGQRWFERSQQLKNHWACAP